MEKPPHNEYRHLFGPVLSRRLGLSLGVDLMPHKTCTLDCIYCECGKTTHLTLARKAYVPVDRVQAELSVFLKDRPKLDFITFSGAGEPTLHSGIQQITRFIKSGYPQYKVALLTNGTLFHLEALRSEVAEIDLVIASLDAATEAVFQRMNRPHPGLDLETIKKGLIRLGKEYPGRLWIEVFMTPGVNDSEDELRQIREMISAIQPEKVQLNTLDRPGTENWVRPLDPAGMARVAACIHSIEFIGSPGKHRHETVTGNLSQRLLAAIRRRPCTVPDLSNMFGISDVEVLKHLELLMEKNGVKKKEMPRGTFYFAG
jgi:wyosine [tRNA(Phe)-imidazoG37] synthetase (radical SAM superfamily)